MQKVDWTVDFELAGEERREALDWAGAALGAWGCVMPPCEPIVFHFGLHDFANVGEIEYWIVNDTDNAYCGKFLFLFENQRCPLHYHNMKDETFYIARGTVEMEVDGEIRMLKAGDVFKMAPRMNHTFAARGGPALVLEVSLPSISGDNIFADKRIGNAGVL